MKAETKAKRRVFQSAPGLLVPENVACGDERTLAVSFNPLRGC